MVDYIKILMLNINIDKLKEKLDFTVDVNTNTGETTETYFCDFHFCKIIIYPSGNVFLKGSLHKFWNSLNDVTSSSNLKNVKGFNGNQFTIIDLYQTINYLLDLFECKQTDLFIQNIEFGINIQTSFNPRLFTKGLLYHKAKSFEFKHRKNYAQCRHSEYIIKIYNKSFHYRINKNILRVEVKFLKSIQLKPFNIITINDLTASNITKALRHVKKTINNVMYYDYTINPKHLSQHLKNKLNLYKSDIYFLEDLNKKQRHLQRKKLDLIIKNNSSNLKEIILKEIDKNIGLVYQELDQLDYLKKKLPYNKQNKFNNYKKELFYPLSIVSSSSNKEVANNIKTKGINKGLNFIFNYFNNSR